MTMTRTERDALVRLEATLQAHTEREQERSKALMDGLAALSLKIDQMHDTLVEQTHDVRGLKSGLANMDIRVATLEQQVDSLRDDAEKARAVAEAMAKAADKRAKLWATASGVTVFVISNGPTILAWLSQLFKALP